MVFFQTCNRTHSDRLPVVDSPQCWGMVKNSQAHVFKTILKKKLHIIIPI